MASGLTHILLTKKLQDELPQGTLKDILAFGSDFLLVGAVGPDLPYASVMDNNFFWKNESKLADKFHYEKTNQIPLLSLVKLKSLKGQIEEELHFKMFAFFMGYTSHVLADGIIHPFVRDKVGNYSENKSAHRSLEMQLDVLLFEELTKKSGFSIELNYSNLHQELLNFEFQKESAKTLEIFVALIKGIYNESYSTKKILGWIKGLYRLFEIAEGEHPRIYRNIEANTFLYKNRSDIIPDKALVLNKPKDRNANFLNKSSIHFFNDCVPQYFRKFCPLAQKAYEYVYQNGVVLNEYDIPLIDLDTGRLLTKNQLDLIPEFWK